MRRESKSRLFFILIFVASLILFVAAAWMGTLALQNTKMYLEKSSDKYDLLSQYAAIEISGEISMDSETQHALDLACMELFRQTNDTALLCCPTDALLLYFHPINSDFFYKKKEALLPMDHLLYVNNNYLTLNPILGFDGEPLSAPEKEFAVTLLVPDNFPLPEEALQQEIQSQATMLHYFPEDQYLYGTEKASTMQHAPLPVNLVYYPAGQQAFLYRPTQTVHIHEALTDPLIWVVTEGNSNPAAQTFYLTNNGYLPHIPAGTQPAEGLEPVLSASGLLPYVRRCYAYSEAQKDTLRSLAPVLGLQIALFLVLALLFFFVFILTLCRSRRGKKLYFFCLTIPLLGMLLYYLYFPFSGPNLVINGVLAALALFWALFLYLHQRQTC